MVSRLTREIAFYRKYHRDTTNVFLHIVGIPTILATSLYNMTPFRIPGYTTLNLGFAMGLYYWYYYSRLDPKLGFGFGAVVAASSWYFGKMSAENPQYFLAWSLWTLGWVGQFIGHGVFEGRAPALFDNLSQAILLAPYFAFLEVAAYLGNAHAIGEIEKVDLVNSDERKREVKA